MKRTEKNVDFSFFKLQQSSITFIRKLRLYLQHIMIFNPFQEDIVNLYNGQWTQEMKLQVTEVTEWGVKQLTALTYLHLAGNNIESVECLARVQMAHIQQLGLGSNNITSVRVMRKAAWPALKVFSTLDNYFGDAKSLVQGCFPQMQELYVYLRQQFHEEKNELVEQNFPAKMQPADIKNLRIKENKYCFDRSITRALQRRWPQVCID